MEFAGGLAERAVQHSPNLQDAINFCFAAALEVHQEEEALHNAQPEGAKATKEDSSDFFELHISDNI